MIAYSITNDTILAVNNKKIDFKHNINKVLEVGDLLIIHTFDSIEKKGHIKMSEQPLNGVYAVDAKGAVKWNIKEIIEPDLMYTGISVNDDGNLVANTFMGIAQIIDVEARKSIGHFVTK